MCDKCYKDKITTPPCFKPLPKYIKQFISKEHKTIYKPQELQPGYEIPDIELVRK